MRRSTTVLVSFAVCILGGLIGTFASLTLAEAACALPTSVKVTLFQAHPDIKSLTVDGAFELSQGGGSSTLRHVEISVAKSGLQWTGGKSVQGGKAVQRAGARIVIRPLGWTPLRLKPGSAEARPYRGRFIITTSGGRLNVINEVDSRSYITSVVGSESVPEFPLEALKAQAVLATTVLARQRPNMKLADSTDVQAYLGSDYERPLAKQAVDVVFGQTLTTTSGTTPAVFYHSTCAGGTSDEREIFSGKVLNDAGRKAVSSCRIAVRVKCSYCQASPFFKPHVVSYTLAELKQKVGCVPISIDVRDPQGRPLSVTVEQVSLDKKQSKNVSLSGYALWLKLGQGLGWGAVPGMRYSFEKTATGSSDGPSSVPNSPPSASAITITSTGAGHGAGLCQWGAAGMAREGKTYKNILHYYFPLAEVSTK
ncbi:hypothetical protein BH11CYA1_BH11CYA1_17730 [soil metagenome]